MKNIYYYLFSLAFLISCATDTTSIVADPTIDPEHEIEDDIGKVYDAWYGENVLDSFAVVENGDTTFHTSVWTITKHETPGSDTIGVEIEYTFSGDSSLNDGYWCDRQACLICRLRRKKQIGYTCGCIHGIIMGKCWLKSDDDVALYIPDPKTQEQILHNLEQTKGWKKHHLKQ